MKPVVGCEGDDGCLAEPTGVTDGVGTTCSDGDGGDNIVVVDSPSEAFIYFIPPDA
jgi:hypothetical protein